MGERVHRTAAVVSVGDELVLGQTLDTNSRWVSQRLLDSGVEVREHVTVGDDLEAMVGTLRRLAFAVDLIVVTGGLGPTDDDLTRAALAGVMGEGLVEDAASVAHLRAWFAGREMPAANMVQAQRPASGVALANPHGTAPGLWGRVAREGGAVDVFCLPGPPREMQPMFEAEVTPRLRRAQGEAVATRVMPTFGLGESEIARRLGDLMDRGREARGQALVGTTASQGVVSIRVRSRGEAGRVAAEVEAVADRCRSLVGDEWILGQGELSLASCVLGLFRQRGWTIALAESCTGGLLGSMLTDVAGSSDAVVGGWVTYSNEMKRRELGVPPEVLERDGAVSGACARAMAEGALSRSGASVALSITGVAGPGGGSEAKPVGTVWVGMAGHGATAARRFKLQGDRGNVRAWASQSALGMARLRAIGREDLVLMREVERG